MYSGNEERTRRDSTEPEGISESLSSPTQLLLGDKTTI
jgi:hypothetical protein